MEKYRGKNFSILGDSISTFEGVSLPKESAFYDTPKKLEAGVLTLSDTWWGQVIERLGGNLLVNNSISGSTVTFHPSYEVPSYGCSAERTGALHKDGVMPDVIFVCLGTNDWGAGVRVTSNSKEKTYFQFAYQTMLEKIKNNYPNAEIWCITPALTCCTRKKDFQFPYFYAGRHIAEYCDAIQECANEHACKTVHLFHGAKACDTIDGFHPNRNGMQTIAERVIACLAGL